MSDAAPSRGRGRASSDAERRRAGARPAAPAADERLERRLQQLLSSRADPNSLCAVAPNGRSLAVGQPLRLTRSFMADELQERVARGAYGVVYKVRIDRTIRSVAVWLCG